jgi:ATP-binding cassette subfamily C protein CydD
VVALAMLGSSATVTMSWSLAYFVSQIFIEHATLESVRYCFAWLAIGGLTKAFVVWLQEFLATRASAAVKVQLRQKLFGAVELLGPSWLAKKSVAEVNLLATSGLDALEPYFSKYLPQLVYTALVTPVFLAIIWLTDLPSGVTLLVTLPLIPLFMILIGWATKSVQQGQLDSLTQLSQHFLEVLRGLTTLKIFGRVDAQAKALERVSGEHRQRTMKVLRVSFLSGFALELIASLAVALIAVSIGLRLLSGELTLMVGLFVLLLAPETYLPLRQVGAQFHASAEGVAASSGILDIIQEAQLEPKSSHSVSVDDYHFAPGELTAIVGPSGVGKSSIFRQLLGFHSSSVGLEKDQVSWLPQASRLFEGTVKTNIVGPGRNAAESIFRTACQLAALDDLTAEHQVGVAGASVSGGQAQRICLARAFYRALESKCSHLLLDEPISALDEARAAVVVQSLKDFATSGLTVVAISHQKLLVNSADRVIEVERA